MKEEAGKLARGESTYRSKDGIMALAFKDKQTVLLLNTAYSISEGTTIKQLNTKLKHNNNNNNIPTYTHIPVPLALASYRLYMGGVDRFTSFLAYYTCGGKCYKWYIRLLHQLIDIAIVNAFIIAKQSTHTANKWRTQKEFRMELCKQLINGRCYRKYLGRPPAQCHNHHNINNNKHIPLNNNNMPHLIQRTHTAGNCVHCYNTQQKRSQCKYVCTACVNINNKHIHLHADCFYAYHT